ncbi:hypothetical protein OAA99_01185 [Omnitrophica bacterium]|nr:hypothetical protein [Candidatus Omnitrophota bacterium]
MEKLRYGVDPYNRLVIQETGKKLPLGRFRSVLDGKFKIGPNNSLIYRIKAPAGGAVRGLKRPHQVKLRGRWSLTKDLDLMLTLDKWRRQTFGDQLTLQGEIIAAEKDSLLFAVTTRTKDNVRSTHILRLHGSWQADRRNRLTFRARKERSRHDILTLDGIWEIGRSHRIVYRYEKARLLRKKRLRKTITFSGYWDITRHNRLSYILDLKGKRRFDFQASISKLEKNSIKYKVGVGVSRKKRPVRRVITLFGTWRLKKGRGLLFEIEYEKGRLHAVAFGADLKLSKRDGIEFRLKNSLGKDLGMRLTLSRRLLKGDGEAFLRLLESGKESAIYVGMARRW